MKVKLMLLALGLLNAVFFFSLAPIYAYTFAVWREFEKGGMENAYQIFPLYVIIFVFILNMALFNSFYSFKLRAHTKTPSVLFVFLGWIVSSVLMFSIGYFTLVRAGDNALALVLVVFSSAANFFSILLAIIVVKVLRVIIARFYDVKVIKNRS